MDTKRLILGMSLAMAVMLGWTSFYNWLDKRHPEWGLVKKAPTEQVTPASAEPPASNATFPSTQAGTSAPSIIPSTTQAGSVISPATSTMPTFTVAPATQAVDVTIGSVAPNDPHYALAMDLSPLGASVNSVTLNEYKKTVEKPDRYVFQQPYVGREEQSRVLTTQWISVDGTKFDLSNVPWTLQSSAIDSAVFSVDLKDAGGPTVRVTKTYRLTDKIAEKEKAAGYEVHVDVSVANLSNRPLQIATAFNGTNAPPNENDRQPDEVVMAGYLNDRYVVVDHNRVTEYTKDKPSHDWTTHKEGYPLAWFGTGSGYFNGLLRPEPATGASTSPYIAKVVATALNPEAKDYHHDVILTIQTQTVTLAANTTVNMPLRAFFFPKTHALLSHDYLQATPLGFDETLVMTSGWCGICTFQWLVNLLVGMLRFFHAILFDWGLAIIALVCVVRGILHPITKKSQVSMLKMGKMGPEMERLKKKYGDDKEGLNKAMMQFYKTQGATPILGCLPMVLQMPIWIALYSALQTTFELRQSPFLHFGWLKLTWINDLAHADRLIQFDHPVSFLFFHITSINVLPVLMAIVYWMQAKYTPRPPATTPEQKQQQKIMQWMTLLFPVFLYSYPAGLNLYIFTSAAIGIIESKIIRKHIKEKEALEAAGVVIVDADDHNPPPPKGGVRRVPPKQTKGGLSGWFASLQQRAEQIKQEAERKKK